MVKITICKTTNPSEHLSQIDTNDAEIDFVNAISENDENLYSVLYQESLVGLALAEEGRHAFLYIYIFPVYRHMGYGKAAAQLFEQKLRACNPANIYTYCLHIPKSVLRNLLSGGVSGVGFLFKFRCRQ